MTGSAHCNRSWWTVLPPKIWRLGRCVKQATTGSKKVLVDIVSTVVRGGPQTAA